MKVIEIDASLAKNWDQITNDEKTGSFMQSIAWGEFKKSLGQKVWNLAVVDDFKNEIFAIAQVVKEELVGFGSFLYVPYGPIFKTNNKEEVLNVLLEKLKTLAQEEKAIFIRLEPKISLVNKKLKFYNTYRQIQHTLKMDLKPSEEELLASFKQKTRYNLHLSQKKGVEIVTGEKEDLSEFITILKSVGARGDFFLPEDKYFYQMFDTLKPKGMVDLLLAKYRGKIIGGFINIYFLDEATYLYGASRDDYRNLMVNYPLMWETISRAKAHGCRRLDFRGANPNEQDQTHPWYGFTRFKRGFAPYSPVESYPGSYFLIAKSLKFYLYYAQKLIRRRPL
jgi:lipid II:glycine glycyltransferase (peptidoglycan interpeptide bridge formation enzyme)